MFGVGMQELLIIGVLCLVIFGPSRLTSMARDAGRFVSQARNSIEDFKSELEFDEDFDELEDEDIDYFENEEDEPRVSGREETDEERAGDRHRPRVSEPGQNPDEEPEEVSLENRA